MRKRTAAFALTAIVVLMTTCETHLLGQAEASGASFVRRKVEPAEFRPRVAQGDTIILKGADNTLGAIAADIQDPSIFSYDGKTRTGVSKANIVIAFGAILTLEGQTLKMDGPKILIKHGGELFMDSSTITTSSPDGRYDFNIFGLTTIRNSTISGTRHGLRPCYEATVRLRNVKLAPDIKVEPFIFSGTLETGEAEAGAVPPGAQTAEYVSRHLGLLQRYLEPKLDILGFDLRHLSGRVEKKTFSRLEKEVTKIGEEVKRKADALEAALSARARSEPEEVPEPEDIELSMAKTRRKYLGEMNRLQDEMEGKIDALSARLGETAARLPKLERTVLPVDDWIEQTFQRGFSYGVTPKYPSFPSPVPDGYEGFPVLFRYLENAGSTIYVGGDSLRYMREEPDFFKGYMKGLYQEAARRNVRVLVDCFFKELKRDERWTCLGKDGQPGRDIYCWNSDGFMNAIKEEIRTATDLVGDYPSFAGFYMDEPRFWGGWCEICQERFREYLKGKYTEGELKALGIDEPDKVTAPFAAARDTEKVLWMEHEMFREHTMLGVFRELMDHMRTLKQDARLCVTINPDVSPARIGQLVDILSCDWYGRGELRQAFNMDLYWSTAGRSMIAAIGVFRDKTARMYERDLCTAYAHCDGLTPFEWSTVWKYRSRDSRQKARYNKAWTPENWNITVDHFARMAKMEKYLIKTTSASSVGLLVSDRTSLLDPANTQSRKGGTLYGSNQQGIYAALSYAHIQCDPLYTEWLTESRLAKYRVLVLSNAGSLTDDEISLITEWVRKGGTLIATASTTLMDEWGRKLPDYRLRDVFGASYLKTEETAEKLTMGIEVGEPVLSDPSFEGETLTCSSRGGYDVVEPGKGRAVAFWADKSPALVVNDFGKGKSVFLTVRHPGIGYSKEERFLTSGDFLPDTTRLFGGLVRGATRAAGGELPFTVSDCPPDTQVTMRAQPGRYILHLENRDLGLATVKGAEARVNLPSVRNVRVFYPDDGEEVKYSLHGNGVTFRVRDFEVHEAVVVEFG